MTYNQTILLRFIVLAILLAVSCTLIFTGCSGITTLHTMMDSVGSSEEAPVASPAPMQTVSSGPAPSTPAPLPAA